MYKGRSKKRILLRYIIRTAVIAGIAFALLLAVRELRMHWDVVVDAWRSMSVSSLLASLFLVTIGFSVPPWAISVLYRDVDNNTAIQWLRLSSAYYIGNFFKYVPGGIATPLYTVQKAGLPKAQFVQSLFTMYIETFLIGGLACILIGASTAVGEGFSWLAYLGVIPFIVAFHPRVTATFLRLLLRLFNRQSHRKITPISTSALLRSTFIMLTVWLLAGVSLVLLVNNFRDLTLLEQAICVIAYPASFVVGFLALMIPAGLGVREAVLIGVLTVYLPLSSTPEANMALAVSIVLTHRFIVTLSDVILLGVGLLCSVLHKIRHNRHISSEIAEPIAQESLPVE